MEKNKVPIEVAIDRAGYGLYSYLMTCLAGACIISFACIAYGNTILVPASACELETTAAQQGALAAAPTVGSILGSLVWGYLSDTRGRRSMLLVALCSSAAVNALASISVNWIMLMILQFIACLLAAGLFSMAMSLLSESVPMMKRNLVVLLVTSIFLLSQGVMAVLAIPIIPLSFSFHLPTLDIYWNSWRTLLAVYAAPSILTAIGLLFVYESPKFVFAKGDEQRTIDILRSIHRINRIKGEFEVNSILKEEVKMADDGTEKKQSQLVPLFKMPLLKYTIIMTTLYVFQQIGAFQVWLPTIANQFVQIVQTGEGSDQPLCSILATAISSPPAVDEDAVPCALNVTALLMVLGVVSIQSLINLSLSFIVNKVGRRNIVMCIATVCGLSGVLVNLVPNAIGSAVFYVTMLQGIIVMGLYTAIIVGLFPTQLRTTAIALPMMGGRMGTFASIQILNLMLNNSCEAGFYLFSAIFFSSAIVAAFLPDDRRLAAPRPPAPTAIPEPKEDTNGTNRTVSQL